MDTTWEKFVKTWIKHGNLSNLEKTGKSGKLSNLEKTWKYIGNVFIT